MGIGVGAAILVGGIVITALIIWYKFKRKTTLAGALSPHARFSCGTMRSRLLLPLPQTSLPNEGFYSTTDDNEPQDGYLILIETPIPANHLQPHPISADPYVLTEPVVEDSV